MTEIIPILNDEEYQRVLKRIDEIFDATPDTPEGEECTRLIERIEAYEEQWFGD